MIENPGRSRSLRIFATVISLLVLAALPGGSRAGASGSAQQSPTGLRRIRPVDATKLSEGRSPAEDRLLRIKEMRERMKAGAGGRGNSRLGTGGGLQGENVEDRGKVVETDDGSRPGALPEKGEISQEGDPWSNVKAAEDMGLDIEYKKPKQGAKFSFNLVDAQLIELIKIIGNITGKSFIIGGKVPNIKATIYAPAKITAGEAYQAFLSVLQVNGVTVIPSGKYLKVLPVGGSTTQNTPIVLGKNAPPGDAIVTQIQPLEYVAAQDLAELLGRFKSADGDITLYAPTNTLIITDYGTSIRRIQKLIKILDVPGTDEQVWIEPINYANAAELADRIIEIFDLSGAKGGAKSGGGGTQIRSPMRSQMAGQRVPGNPPNAPSVVGEEESDTKVSKIITDERTNSLIIVASESAYLRILELIKRLDVPIAGEGTLHVHKLQHADATELAKTLTSLSKTGGAAPKTKAEGEGAAELFEGEMQISADKATNSLVIVSSLRDYISLMRVIEALDRVQRQVFVEAVIMEVSLDKSRDLGMGLHVGKDADFRGEKGLIYASSQPNDKLNSLLLGPGAMSGLAAGIRGPEIEGTEELLGAGVSIPAFGVALQALQTNSDVNVLSTPHILATDNEEASIKVGENVPVQAGINPMGALLGSTLKQQSGAGSAASGLLGGLGMGGLGYGMGFNINRQDVGLTLKITPHINDDNQVRLEIDLEISEVKGIDPNTGPTISKQNAITTSVVSDQQTIVIGGLITDNQVETTRKVPVLGDIPIIGFFFRHKSSLTRKRNLLIFLTPYIIRGADDFREIFEHKMAERREFIERYTAFEYYRYDPHLDWSRTNGAIAEINKIIETAEEEEALRKQSEVDNSVEHTPKTPIMFPHKTSSGNPTVGQQEPPSEIQLIEPVQVLGSGAQKSE